METFLSTIKDISDKRWIVNILLPAAVFVGAVMLIFLNLTVGWSNILFWWKSYTVERQFFIVGELFLVCFLVAILLDFLTDKLLRLFSCSSWRKPFFQWLLRGVRNGHVKTFQRLASRYQELGSKKDNLSDQEKDELAELEERIRLYPPNEKHIGPSFIGNVFTAAVDYVKMRFGLDVRTTWLMLYSLLSEQLREALLETRLKLDLQIRCIVLMSLYGIIQTIAALHMQQFLFGSVVLVGTIPLLLVMFNWMNMIAVEYGECVRAAYAVHRFDLYSSLRIQPPQKSGADEVATGALLSNHLWRGLVEVKYKETDSKK